MKSMSQINKIVSKHLNKLIRDIEAAKGVVADKLKSGNNAELAESCIALSEMIEAKSDLDYALLTSAQKVSDNGPSFNQMNLARFIADSYFHAEDNDRDTLAAILCEVYKEIQQVKP
jgi:hypothetical protein